MNLVVADKGTRLKNKSSTTDSGDKGGVETENHWKT